MTQGTAPNFFVLERADKKWEQMVYGEVLLPNIPNVYGDIYTPEAIREFVLQFALQGYGIDVDHDRVDILGKGAIVVESFIARPGDQDFIEGSWVVGMKILDAELWQEVLDGNINGYSFEAVCDLIGIVIPDSGNRVISGVTEPDPFDGHTHDYTVIVNTLNQVVSGGTGVTDGHYHVITYHTITGKANDHTHRYQVIPDHQEEEQ